MDIKRLDEQLKKSREFKEWKKKNPKAYLVHFFKFSEEIEGDWQIGYYDKEKDRITTFLTGEQIGILPEEEVFKKERTIKRLSMGKVKIDEKKAFKIVKRMKNRGYKKEAPLKTIIILQNLVNLGQVWNITFITGGFNTLNFKVNAETGEVMEHKLTSLVNFEKGG